MKHSLSIIITAAILLCHLPTFAQNMPAGAAKGDMLYWNGSAWASLPAGANGQVLTENSGVPSWVNTTPTIVTAEVSSVTATTASCGGNISGNGGAPVTVRGVCWSASPSPTAALATKTTDGKGSGSYTSTITGLLFGTKYYVRAYATNSAGTAYGAELTFTAANTIGSKYGGGIIAYILQPGDNGYDPAVPHGLIAAPADQGAGLSWGCDGKQAGNTSVLFGTGYTNTQAINYSCGVGTAANICADLAIGDYKDWYLPSKDELNKLFINRAAIGGFADAVYLSSSELSNNYAWVQFFEDGSILPNHKTNLNFVRAVRSF